MAYDCWELSTEYYRDVIEGKIHFRRGKRNDCQRNKKI